MRRREPLALALVSLALSSCGGTDEATPPDDGATGGGQKAAVLQVVKRYQTAALEDDGAAFCDQLAGDGKRELVATAAALGGPVGCKESAERILELAGRDELARIRKARRVLGEDDVKLDGRRAVVRFPSGTRLRMVRTDAGWLVADPDTR